MNDEWYEGELPDELEKQLDLLLNNWAGHVRLTSLDTQFDISDMICVISNDLSYDWWRQLFDKPPFKNNSMMSSFWYFNKNAI